VELTPFNGALVVIVPVPQVYARIFCALKFGCCHVPILPDGNVPIGVYVDLGDVVDVYHAQEIYESHKDEIVAAARKLIVSEQCRN